MIKQIPNNMLFPNFMLTFALVSYQLIVCTCIKEMPINSIQNNKCANCSSLQLHRLLQQYHEYKIQQFFWKRRRWTTSNIGHLLFKNDQKKFASKNKTFVIFVWKYWTPWFYARHMSNHIEDDPLENCSVKNCIVTNEHSARQIADAVVYNVQPGFLPRTWRREPYQRWVFLSDESPKNMFSQATYKPMMSNWANVFNWTMTYRTDSDVPIPYGRTLPLPTMFSSTNMPESIVDLIPNWRTKRRDVLLTVLMSSCHVTKRMDYIKQLQEYITVDVYGKCSHNNKNSCPGRYKMDCPILNQYVFYLAFENSGCRQYLTEKTFFNSFTKGAIPIIMGLPRKDCEKLLPPYSYLHVDDFRSPKALSEYIRRLNMNDDKLLMYHQWRRFFRVVNEHGYSGTKSYAVCRLCEALNYNDDSSRVYSEDDLKLFTDFDLLCKY